MSDHPQDRVPPVDPDLTRAQPETPESPRTIGPYRLLQLVGEGGMGEVWLAEQTQPVRRQVALKVIKAGMDTRQVVARFEAERQALALMDHRRRRSDRARRSFVASPNASPSSKRQHKRHTQEAPPARPPHAERPITHVRPEQAERCGRPPRRAWHTA